MCRHEKMATFSFKTKQTHTPYTKQKQSTYMKAIKFETLFKDR
jgi:hypothetical protein